MILLIFTLLFMFLMYINSYSFFMTGRLFLMKSNLGKVLSSLFPHKSYSFLFTYICLFFLIMNLFSNLPFSSGLSMYYFFTMSVSFSLWVGLFITIMSSQMKDFISHLLPYGSPMFLSFILPIIEAFSHLIRPMTLMIRLSTNLSSGHIMLYMFSLFSLSSLFMQSMIFFLLFMLIILEVMISMLQAYIFTSLSYMYLSETVQD